MLKASQSGVIFGVGDLGATSTTRLQLSTSHALTHTSRIWVYIGHIDTLILPVLPVPNPVLIGSYMSRWHGSNPQAFAFRARKLPRHGMFLASLPFFLMFADLACLGLIHLGNIHPLVSPTAQYHIQSNTGSLVSLAP